MWKFKFFGSFYKFQRYISFFPKKFLNLFLFRFKLVLLSRFIIVNCIFTLLFALWFFVEIPLGSFYNTQIISSNIIEGTYYLFSDMFWKLFLEKIETVNNLERKKTLLLSYIDWINVSQMYDPLYQYKSQAIASLVSLYQNDKQWSDLRTILKNYNTMDPERHAPYYYLLGYSYEQENRLQEAEISYYKALTIDATHVDTLKQLVPILFKKGQFYQAEKIIQPYLFSSSYQNNYICFFWGDDGFDKFRQFCQLVNPESLQDAIYIKFSGTYLVDAQNLAYFRIDPIAGNFHLKRLTINTNYGKHFSFTDFSSWALSPDLRRNSSNDFVANDIDPYLYQIFDYPLVPIDIIDSIELELIYLEGSLDKQIVSFLSTIKSKKL